MATGSGAPHADFKDTMPTDFGAELSEESGGQAAPSGVPALRLLALLLGVLALAMLGWGALDHSGKAMAVGGVGALLAWGLRVAGLRA